MGHDVRLLAGPPGALRRYLDVLPGAAIYALTPGAAHLVLPLTDDIHDALHSVYGTGEWLAEGPRLSSGDLAFAIEASRGTALAYLETVYFGGAGEQSAMLWVGGGEILRPTRMTAAEARTRPPAFWPINVALKGLGVRAAPGADEFTTFGLGLFRSAEDIIGGAVPVARS